MNVFIYIGPKDGNQDNGTLTFSHYRKANNPQNYVEAKKGEGLIVLKNNNELFFGEIIHIINDPENNSGNKHIFCLVKEKFEELIKTNLWTLVEST